MRLNHFKKTAVSIFLGMGMVQFAQAQTANATLSYVGSVTANTCTLQLSDGVRTVNNTNLNVDFGTFSLPTTVAAIGTALGTPKTLTFTARNAANTAACAAPTLTGDRATFNVLLDINAAQIVQPSAGLTYIANGDTNGTNAVLAFARGASIVTTTPLGLTARSGNTTSTLRGTFAAAGGVTLGSTPGTIQLTAQLATRAAAVPTAGNFSASIPLFLVYQ
jgi:hypothetical protein